MPPSSATAVHHSNVLAMLPVRGRVGRPGPGVGLAVG